MDLKKGSAGPLVYTLQEMLNDWQMKDILSSRNSTTKYNPLKLTGKFDGPTDDRVREFQLLNDLTVTGVVDDITSTVITRSGFDFETTGRPLVVKQDQTRYECWAASLEGWTSAKTTIPTMMKDDAIKKFGAIAGAIGTKGGLTTKGWSAVVKHFKLAYKAYGGSKAAPIEALTIDSLYRRMKQSGLLLVAYNLPGSTVAHTIVIFGVNIEPDEKTPPKDWYGIRCMDPWKNERRVDNIGVITKGGAVLVMWR